MLGYCMRSQSLARYTRKRTGHGKMAPMKKFKVTPHAKSLNDPELDPLLAEHNLLKLAFISYTHLPLGLVAAILMVTSSWVMGRPVWALEHLLFAFMAISAMAFHPSFACWCTYHPQRQKLKNARNGLIANGIFPLIFGSLFMYTALPLDTAVIALGLAMLVLMVFYARPLGGKGKALREIPLLRKLTPALLLGGLTLVPALAPDAPHPLWGMALATSVFVIATGFSLLRPQTLPLTSHAQ